MGGDGRVQRRLHSPTRNYARLLNAASRSTSGSASLTLMGVPAAGTLRSTQAQDSRWTIAQQGCLHSNTAVAQVRLANTKQCNNKRQALRVDLLIDVYGFAPARQASAGGLNGLGPKTAREIGRTRPLQLRAVGGLLIFLAAVALHKDTSGLPRLRCMQLANSTSMKHRRCDCRWLLIPRQARGPWADCALLVSNF